MIALSKHRSNLPTPVYPRPIVREDTPEQQAEAFARARRRALHLQLHDLFAYTDNPSEDTFGGKMNLPPEKSDSSTGCSLTHPFVSWLETHELPDVTETKRRRRLFTALARLAHEREDLSMVVVEHSRTHTSLNELAKRWRVSNHATTEGFAEGLDLMLVWLGSE